MILKEPDNTDVENLLNVSQVTHLKKDQQLANQTTTTAKEQSPTPSQNTQKTADSQLNGVVNQGSIQAPPSTCKQEPFPDACQIEQTTSNLSHSPNKELHQQIPVGTGQDNTYQPKRAPTNTLKNQLSEPVSQVRVLPSVDYCEPPANRPDPDTAEVKQTTEEQEKQASEQIASPQIQSSHLSAEGPQPEIENKNAPLKPLNDPTTSEGINSHAASTLHHAAVDGQTTNDDLLANQVIVQIMRHVRYLLTLKGRPPLRLAGIFMYQRLLSVCDLLDDLLAHRYDYYLRGYRETRL
ncbi:MAG: hypothetical protein ACPGWR_15105 [Ardenticatenaceae bacterium]